ncbi:aldo/keto reductase [Candidatus Latescibacterota bacterium]
MNYRMLGSTPLTLSVVGLGTWAIGGTGYRFAWGKQDDDDSIRAIHRALDEGINWIDTAAVYGLGHAEEIVGKALRGMSEKPLIATKGGRIPRSEGTIYGCLKRSIIRREVEDSLRRLDVETIDLYQIHWPDPVEDIEEAWEEIAHMVGEGKIRHAGASNFSVDQLARIAPIHPIASLQPPYSMLRRDAERELLPYCFAHGIGVIVYSPMQKGLLTGAFTLERAATLPEDDHRKRDPMFQEPLLSKILELVGKQTPIAENAGHTVAQLAIAWVLSRPEVTAAIVGGRNPFQVAETAPAGDWTLSPAERDAVDAIIAEFEAER